MTVTLDVRGDMTFVKFDGKTVGMVQPDAYAGHGWSSWRPTRNVWDSWDYEFERHHDTREQALAACGWHEGGQR